MNTAGAGPLAEAVGWDLKKFQRVRKSNPKLFHTYPDNTSFVTSLEAWGTLYDAVRAKGIARRTQNLRQFAQLETLTTDDLIVPRIVPASTQNRPTTTPLDPRQKRKTR